MSRSAYGEVKQTNKQATAVCTTLHVPSNTVCQVSLHLMATDETWHRDIRSL